MCENSKTPVRPNDDKLNLIATRPINETMPKLCSCLINTTSNLNSLSVKISHKDKDATCFGNLHDSAALEIIRSGERDELLTLNKDNLSDVYTSSFHSVSAI